MGDRAGAARGPGDPHAGRRQRGQSRARRRARRRAARADVPASTCPRARLPAAARRSRPRAPRWSMVDGDLRGGGRQAAAEGARPGCFELADVGASGPASWVIDGYATLFSELDGALRRRAGPGRRRLAGRRGGALGRARRGRGDRGRARRRGVPDRVAGRRARRRRSRRPARRWRAWTAPRSARRPGRRCSPGIRGTVTVSDDEARAAMRELAAAGPRDRRLRRRPAGRAARASLRPRVRRAARRRRTRPRPADRHRGPDRARRLSRRYHGILTAHEYARGASPIAVRSPGDQMSLLSRAPCAQPDAPLEAQRRRCLRGPRPARRRRRRGR